MFDRFKFWRKKIGEKSFRSGGVVDTGHSTNTVWSDRNYENFIREAYMKNVISFACIDRIAKAVSLVPWELYKHFSDGEKERDLTHPFNKVLNRANLDESWMMFLYGSISYLCSAGNSFVRKIAPSGGANAGIPLELWKLRPDYVTIITDKESGRKIGYTYDTGKDKEFFEINPVTGDSEVLQLKLFHPLNECWGMSPIEPAARKIDSSNSMDEWNKNLLDNSGRPGMLFFFKDGLDEESYQRLRRDIREKIEGPKNAGKSHILEGANDAKPYGFTPSEMDWINSNTELARSICIAWGVPGQLINLPDISTYANYQEARTAFHEDTVIFYLRMIQSEFNAWLFNDSETLLEFNLDDIPAMQFKRNLRWERAQKADFLEINEKRALVDFDEVEGGDVILVQGSLIPLGSASEEDLDEEDELEEIEEETRANLRQQGFTDSEIESLVK